MRLPLAGAISMMERLQTFRSERDAVQADLFAEAERIIDMLSHRRTCSGGAVLFGFSEGILREWLRRASPFTLSVFLKVYESGTLPDLNAYAGILVPPIPTVSRTPPEMLLREVLEYHHLVDYQPDDMHEVLASIAAVHIYRKGREDDPWDVPGTLHHDEDKAMFMLSFALRYSRFSAHVRHEKFDLLFTAAVPTDPHLIAFAVQYPERIPEIAGVRNDRPEADGETIVEILTSPSKALSDGVL